MRTAFIGLGVMGYPMAGHLARAGHEVAVFNRTARQGRALGDGIRRRRTWRPRRAQHRRRGRGGRAGRRSASATMTTCARWSAWRCRRFMRARSSSTTRPHRPSWRARWRTRRRGAGLRLPRRAGLRRPGGRRERPAGDHGRRRAGAVERARPVIGAYAKAIQHIGGPGAGQLTKMVNQICIAGVVQGLAEAVHFAGKRAASTARWSTRRSRRARRSPGRWTTAGRRWARASSTSASRSTGCARTSAWCWTRRRSNGARLEVTALVDQFYAEVQAMGGRRWDTSSLAARLDRPDNA